MSRFEQTPLNQVRRLAQRGAYDRETIYAIVDEALICHVGFSIDSQPYVIPTIHVRMGDRLIFHGAPASRMIKHIGAGHPFCVSVTHLDGLVLARSAFHHSMNYRSAVLFGTGTILADNGEKCRALEALVEHVTPGRWQDARRPSAKELQATTVVAMAIESASAKVRTGHPVDDEEDHALSVWAGILPIEQRILTPMADPKLSAEIPLPSYLAGYE